ncbi:MAG TPA: carbohydrate ABC transporter permease [Atribacteraceae bacterium]|nr:carbohydrate ABC transporter permease [Atribacteraceae bacterium]
MNKKSTMMKNFLKHFVLILVAAVVLFPFFWIILQSFKTSFDVIAYPPKFIFQPTWQNYLSTLQRQGFLMAFRDSLLVSLGSVILTLLIGTPFGYVLSRFRFRGREDIGFYVLSTRMMPPIVVIIPFVRIFHALGIIDTHVGLILAGVLVNLALVVWMMRGFFSGIPAEIDEAALIDGCSRLSALRWIVLPLVTPGLVSTAMLSFLFSWNEFIFALSLTSFNVRTLPVYIATEFIGYLAVDWGALSAAGVLAILPGLLFIIAIQKHLVKGLTFGAIK